MRSILLPLTSDPADNTALETGFRLARQFDSHLTLLYVRPQFGTSFYAHSVSNAGYVAMIQSLQTDAERREETVRQMVVSAAAEQGIALALEGKGPEDAQASFEIGIGEDDVILRRFAPVNDMVLFPRKSRPGETLEASSLLKSALEYSGRPILVTTDELAKDFGSKVAIAWNGSAEGARAVTAALPILSRADDVVIFTVATGGSKVKEGERLQGYLKHHGIKSRSIALDLEISVARDLIDAAKGSGANLLVSGGYTHGRMRQTLFGGVTHELLETCSLPLLLAH